MWIVLVAIAVAAACVMFIGYLAFSVIEFILPELFELAVAMLEALWLGVVFIFRRIKSYF